jgi:hypothetical protein
MYLVDSEFLALFEMTKEQFKALPAWKQKQKKQQLSLF